ncbi:MAG: polysaccharide biosynthesis tyrosine autokinase [Chloroflexi bacterium]|nr:polysaccharide biosynthesis tyrosine autokinase [Chloroflexota bacterium]
MEIRQYIAVLWRWWWLIVMGALAAGAASFLISRAQDPVYEATSILFISEGAANTSTDFSSLQYSERLAQSYVQRLTNYEVLAQAITNLGISLEPGDLKKNTRVSLLNNSQLISLNVEHTDPRIAALLANEIPTVFAERNQAIQLERYANSKANLESELLDLRAELTGIDAALAEAQRNGAAQATIDRLSNQSIQLRDTHTRILQNFEDIRVAEASSLNNIIIDEYARIPDVTVRPRTVTNTLLALIVGGMVAVGAIFLIEYLDDTIADPTSVEQSVGLALLGNISRMQAPEGENCLVMIHEPRSPTAEAYRQLRTNVQYVGVIHELRTMLVTSANMAEGKSTTASNLAVALAQAGHRTLLVDADLRRPSLHRLFDLTNHEGLTNLLLNPDGNDTYFQETNVPDLRVLTSGPLPPFPAELIASERMTRLVAVLAEQADYVIFDSPPVLVVTDAVLLSQITDTTLIVVEAGRTRTQALVDSVQQITAVNGHIAGVLLNKIDARRGNYYYYHNSGYYHEEGLMPASRKMRIAGLFTLSVSSLQFCK